MLNATSLWELYGALEMLCYAKCYIPLGTVQMICKSLIKPYFRYCFQVWGNASNKNIQNVRNRVVSIVANSPYDTHSKPLIKELCWLTNKPLIDTETIKSVHKALHNEAKYNVS